MRTILRTAAMLTGCVALVACRLGYDSTDGVAGDGEVGEPGPVSVRVVDPNGPVRANPVFFNSADGTLLGTELTDLDGNLSFVIPPGAMVTVIHPDSDDSWVMLETLANIQPGDALTFGTEYDEWAGAGDAIILPQSAVPGAVEYVFEVGCNSVVVADVSVQTVIEVPRSCAPVNQVTIIGHAHDLDSNDLIWSFAKDVPMSPDTAPVTLSSWSNAMDSYNLVVDDTPTGASLGMAGIGSVVNGVSFGLWPQEMDFSVGEFTHGREYPLGLSDGLDYIVGINHPSLTVGASSLSPASLMISRTEDPVTLQRISAAELLPGIVDIGFDPKAPARPVLSFALENDDVIADVGLGSVSWTDVDGNDYGWKICFNPGVRDFQLPELPGFLGNVVAPASPDEYKGMEFGVMDFDFVADYASVRNDYPYGGLEDEYYYPAGEYKVRASLSLNPWADE